jgi:hypothetical protein
MQPILAITLHEIGSSLSMTFPRRRHRLLKLVRVVRESQSDEFLEQLALLRYFESDGEKRNSR